MLGEMSLCFQNSLPVAKDEAAIYTESIQGVNEFIASFHNAVFPAMNQF